MVKITEWKEKVENVNTEETVSVQSEQPNTNSLFKPLNNFQIKENIEMAENRKGKEQETTVTLTDEDEIAKEKSKETEEKRRKLEKNLIKVKQR